MIRPNYIRNVKGPFPTVRLTQFINYIWSALGKEIKLPKVEDLTVVFASPKDVAALNGKYRGKPKPTDVLSFSPIEPSSLGELVLCPKVIVQQAKDHQWSEFNEYSYMVLHGLLHLLGYDHEKDDKKAQQMYRLQDRIFFRYLKASGSKKRPGKNVRHERRNRTDRN